MKKHLYYLFIVLIAFLIACDEESTPTEVGTDPVIEEITMRDKWNSASIILSKVEVKVTDPQGFSDIAGVLMEVRNSSDQVILSDSLYDDGAYIHTQDGDVIAGDGIYTNQFSAVQILSGAGDGDYEFSFMAFDKENHQSTIVEKSALFGPNALPEIINVVAFDTLFSGTEGQFVYATVFDSDGIEDIQSVYFEIFDSTNHPIEGVDLYNDGNFNINGDLFADDSIYSMKLDSNYASSRLGLYTFQFHVKDSFDEENNIVPESPIYIENFVGTILLTSVPDSIEKPTNPGSTIPFELNALVTDPQGLYDVKSVYFLSEKPDGTFSGNGFHFELFDDGDQQNNGDDIANDGEFSKIIEIADSNDPGVYKFHFYMLDQVGHLTDVALDSILVY